MKAVMPRAHRNRHVALLYSQLWAQVTDTLPGRRCTRADARTSWSQECSGTSRRVALCSEWARKLRWLSSGPAASWGPLPRGKWHQTWPSRSSARSPCWGRRSRAGCAPSSRCASWRPPASRWRSSLHSAPCGPRGRSSGTPAQQQGRTDIRKPPGSNTLPVRLEAGGWAWAEPLTSLPGGTSVNRILPRYLLAVGTERGPLHVLPLCPNLENGNNNGIY